MGEAGGWLQFHLLYRMKEMKKEKKTQRFSRVLKFLSTQRDFFSPIDVRVEGEIKVCGPH